MNINLFNVWKASKNYEQTGKYLREENPSSLVDEAGKKDVPFFGSDERPKVGPFMLRMLGRFSTGTIPMTQNVDYQNPTPVQKQGQVASMPGSQAEKEHIWRSLLLTAIRTDNRRLTQAQQHPELLDTFRNVLMGHVPLEQAPHYMQQQRMIGSLPSEETAFQRMQRQTMQSYLGDTRLRNALTALNERNFTITQG